MLPTNALTGRMCFLYKSAHSSAAVAIAVTTVHESKHERGGGGRVLVRQVPCLTSWGSQAGDQCLNVSEIWIHCLKEISDGKAVAFKLAAHWPAATWWQHGGNLK